MSLTVLPDDVLLHIFSFLNLMELLEIHNTSKRLRQVSKLDLRKFDSVFRKVILRFYGPHKCILIGKGAKYVSLTLFLRYIRFFGPIIKVLTLDGCMADIAEFQQVFCYINRYCVNLEILRFENIEHSVGRTLKKPFKKVRKIMLIRSNIRGRLCDIDKWFPKVDEVYGDESRFERVQKSFAACASQNLMDHLLIRH